MTEIVHGDCREVMVKMASDGVLFDAIITDPPYGLNFMNKSWDNSDNIAFDPQTWRLAYDLLPPGGHMAVFGGSRTHHRLACAIEDAGFELRDTLFWIYGSGFPKSLDVSKAIDKTLGAEREVIGFDPTCRLGCNRNLNDDNWSKIGQQGAPITAPATPEAQRYAGFGTSLKPAYEPVILARKPLAGTVAANVLAHGTGALNIDATRVDGKRWPSNILTDGSPEVLGAFAAFGTSRSRSGGKTTKALGRMNDDAWVAKDLPRTGHDDEGSPARFFPALGYEADELRFMYCPKAGKAERGGASHPTVKPLALMRWLVRLITPPGGTVLDMFAGSGTTGLACQREGFDCVLVEREAEYVAMARRRLGLDFSLEAAD